VSVKEIKGLLEATRQVASNNERDYNGHSDDELLTAVRRAEVCVQTVATLIMIRKARDDAEAARAAEARAKQLEATMDDLLHEQRDKLKNG
jgi:DNA-binding transcriptional MerR regulator